jgi:hypothetical protein
MTHDFYVVSNSMTIDMLAYDAYLEGPLCVVPVTCIIIIDTTKYTD